MKTKATTKPVEVLFRTGLISAAERSAEGEDDRLAELSFSSTEPVDRWFGREILDHDPKSVRMGRMTDGGPLLMDHDTRDQVGVIEKATIDGERGTAVVRFSKSERAQEILQDVRDGIRKNVSVGYRMHKAILEEQDDERGETYRVTDWEPLEVSLVAVPADSTVGVGRAADENDKQDAIFLTREAETPDIEPEKGTRQMSDENTPEVNVEEIQREARAQETRRVQEINAVNRQFSDVEGIDAYATESIAAGRSLQDFQNEVLKRLGETGQAAPQVDTSGKATDIGLTEREAGQFSFVKLIRTLSDPQSARLRKEAAFELEVTDEATAQRGSNSDGEGVQIPTDVLRAPMKAEAIDFEREYTKLVRDLTVGTATAGGNTVSTDLLASSFIDLLRNRMKVREAGAQVLSGLAGNVAIPRQTGGATAYWVAESGAPTESQAAFDQVTMSPNTVGAFSDLSRKLILQSSIDIEAFVRRDLATIMALEIDRVAINGSGASNQPEGILQTSGIGSVVGGTNGAAPDWDDIVDLESAVAVDNADVGSLAYMFNAATRGVLKKTKIDAGSGEFVWPVNGTSINGYAAHVSNQVPSDLTKGTAVGVASAMIYGNWSDLIIGEWGGLSLLVDPYTGGTSGTVRVIVLQDMDIAVRHPESFAAMTDVLT